LVIQRTRIAVSVILIGLVAACSNGGGSVATSSVPPSSPGTSKPIGEANFDQLRTRSLRLPALGVGAPCPTTPPLAFNLNGNSIVGRGKGPFRFGPYGPPLIVGDGNKTPWSVDPNYAGLLLVRGQRLDAHDQVTFGFWPTGFGTPAQQPGVPVAMTRQDSEGRTVVYQAELDIAADADRAGPFRVGAQMWSYPAAGCYAIQADGENFTEVTIVKVGAA
jgi:hypothetical protein